MAKQKTIYWVLLTDLGLTYGIGEPIEGATTYTTEAKYKAAVKKAEKAIEKQLKDLEQDD